jgi:transposase-like protein
MPSKYQPSESGYRHGPHSGKKKAPTGTDADLNLSTLQPLFHNEDKARAFLESKRWPNGPVCPHCKCAEVYPLTAKPGSKTPVRPGVYKCKACRQQFTVRIGTIFEESKIPLSKWLMAIHLMTSSKKGISSHQMARELGVTQKSAWFLNHRIREAMKQEPMAGMLQGTVEVDETYVGGKPRRGSGKKSQRGRGTAKKPVMVLVERDGSARAVPLDTVSGKTLKGQVAVHVAKEAIVMTDEFAAYTGLESQVARHETVNHSAGQYSRVSADGMTINTNTAESFFALLKRGHYGTFHQLSKQHLHRYCNEFGFRWTERKVTDGERMVAAIKGAEGRRLMYG